MRKNRNVGRRGDGPCGGRWRPRPVPAGSRPPPRPQGLAATARKQSELSGLVAGEDEVSMSVGTIRQLERCLFIFFGLGGEKNADRRRQSPPRSEDDEPVGRQAEHSGEEREFPVVLPSTSRVLIDCPGRDRIADKAPIEMKGGARQTGRDVEVRERTTSERKAEVVVGWLVSRCERPGCWLAGCLVGGKSFAQGSGQVCRSGPAIAGPCERGNWNWRCTHGWLPGFCGAAWPWLGLLVSPKALRGT